MNSTGCVTEASGVKRNKEHTWMIYMYIYPAGWVNEASGVGGNK